MKVQVLVTYTEQEYGEALDIKVELYDYYRSELGQKVVCVIEEEPQNNPSVVDQQAADMLITLRRI